MSVESLHLWLAAAVTFTILTSALCSVLEAMVLSTTTAEVEALKNKAPLRGHLLARYREEIEETSSAILSLNTIANTAGASISGALAVRAFGDDRVVVFSAGMVMAILLFSEVIPKNVGVLYRPSLQPILVYPLQWIRIIMTPVSVLCRLTVGVFVRRPVSGPDDADEEIILLAEKSAKDGDLSEHERAMILNALNLDEVQIGEIMTPRTVVTAFEESATVAEVVGEHRNIPFARLPVYRRTIDEVVGVVRRRDLLGALADGKGTDTVGSLMRDTFFVPETASAADALQAFLKKNQQLAVTVDEYGSVAGVVTMEDVIECLLGQEIFEHDDVAVDMRELARKKRVSSRAAG